MFKKNWKSLLGTVREVVILTATELLVVFFFFVGYILLLKLFAIDLVEIGNKYNFIIVIVGVLVFACTGFIALKINKNKK